MSSEVTNQPISILPWSGLSLTCRFTRLTRPCAARPITPPLGPATKRVEMGRAKQLMMEMEETQWEDADASFCCPNCDCEVEGSTSLPVVYEHGGEEHLPVSVLCFGCNMNFEGWVKTDWFNCEIELDEYPDVVVKASPARGSTHDYEEYDQDYFEWLEHQELSSRPVLKAFLGTINDVEALAVQVSLEPKSQMLARMLLAQSITALEVFLSDTLILAVLSYQIVQEKLLRSKSLEIGTRQFSLMDALGVEDFAKEKLLEHLRSVSFHNLGKVSGLYRIGMGIEILSEGDDAEVIQKSIRLRHDCVHRNGKNQETGESHIIDQLFILCLTSSLVRMVKSVDDKVRAFEAKS